MTCRRHFKTFYKRNALQKALLYSCHKSLTIHVSHFLWIRHQAEQLPDYMYIFFTPGIIDLFCELGVVYFPVRVYSRMSSYIELLLSYFNLICIFISKQLSALFECSLCFTKKSILWFWDIFQNLPTFF